MLYTPKQICARNNVSLSTFRRKTKQLEIFFKKSGKRKRYYNETELELIEKYLDNLKLITK